MTTEISTVLNSGELTMSSREIAELTGKDHRNVMRDIRSMLDELGLGELSFERSYLSNQNKTLPCYNLPKDLTITLVSGYNITMRHRIITRWMELEQQQALPQINFLNPVEAARAFADAYEQKLIAEQTAAEAIRTKALIGSKREATAMNTASQLAKQVKKLEAELDKSTEYASIKKMSILTNGRKFSWKKLISVSSDMGMDIIEIPDINFGNVNAYHKNVWEACYGLDINDVTRVIKKKTMSDEERFNSYFG